MALYVGEEEVWKCPKHPSKRRRNGVCPSCLRDRLGILCPDCANIRPCGCCTTATSSSLFSSFSSSSRATAPDDSAAVFRVGTLIETEPRFQKSRSVAVPFLRSRFSTSMRENTSDGKVKTASFWSSWKLNKTRKGGIENREDSKVRFKGDWVENSDEENCYYNTKIGDFEKMMMKSRSMRAPITMEKSSSKGKLWHFPSPIKVFRQRSKVVQDRSPLQRF